MAAENHKFVVLDAIRGVAACAVVCLHLHIWMGSDFFGGGYLAVDIFFVLSGFVISYAFDKRFAAGMTVGRFAAIRYIRFYPMLFLGVLLGAAKVISIAAVGRAPFGIGAAATASILNIVMLPYPLPGISSLFPTNTAVWTLFFEFIINVSYAALFRWLTATRLWAITGLSFVVLAAWNLTDSNLFFEIPGFILRTLLSFTLGAALFRSKAIWSSWMPKLPAAVILLAVALLLFPAMEQPFRAIYDLVFVAIASPMLIAAGSEATLHPRLLPIATWLGVISFPIYALNIPVRNLIPVRLAPVGVYNPSVALAVLLFVVVVSAPVEQYFDIPLRNLLKRRFLRKV